MTAGTLTSIPLSKIQIHTANTRRPQTSDGIKELAASIREQGVLEPIIAIQRNGTYLAVAGSRRVAAAKIAGLSEIPAIVRDMSDEEATAAALVENLQRKDLTPLEEAAGYKAWLALTGKKQSELAVAVAKDPSTISNALRLLKAPAFVQNALSGKSLTPAHARVLLQVKDPAQYEAIAEDLGKRADKVTVDELKELVDESNDSFDTKGPGAVAAAKAFLEDARKKHPKSIITWKASTNWQEQQTLDMVEALGEPPARIAGPVRESEKRINNSWDPDAQWPTAAAHKKHCDCDAYQVRAEQSFMGMHSARLRLELRRVCVVAKNYREAKPAAPKRQSYSSTATAPSKPLTPEQEAKREAAARKAAAARVARELAPAKARGARFAPIFKRLGKGQIPADVARAFLYIASCGMIEGTLYGNAEQAAAWQQIAKMPAKKAGALAAGVLAREFERHLDMNSNEETAEADALVFGYFGVKLPEPKKPKAKKAAKRG